MPTERPVTYESVMPQAGQVWFPDSAFKTAQAIRDFAGEGLPIVIFANWRGFSGGTRDMHGEILKFGAMIVDALVACTRPVTVYIPPNGELRGGAWVVVDPTINEAAMEMYADAQSRGGILEPPGICEVKFRAADQLKAMHRLDAPLQALDAELAAAAAGSDARAAAAAKVKAREEALAPLYMQVAHEFADLHDRAGRMKAKGVVREVLEWPRAREYLYWRTRRRLAEDEATAALARADAAVAGAKARAELEALAGAATYADDQAMLAWLEGDGAAAVAKRAGALRVGGTTAAVQKLLDGLTPAERAAVLAGLPPPAPGQ